MPSNIELYVGTAGHSTWFSSDLGLSWMHPNSHSGMYLEARVWVFSSHPSTPEILLAGTDMGLFSWNELTTRWQHLPSPMQDIWALAQDPRQAQIIYAGTRPGQVYKSLDTGQTWQALQIPDLASFSQINLGATRCTQLLIDPLIPNEVWLTVEIGGIFKTSDGGLTWQMKSHGLESMDVHGIAITRKTPSEKILFATTNRGLHRSTDDGDTWVFIPLDSPWQYTRNIMVDTKRPHIIWLTNGNGPPGSTGRLLKSQDYGDTWTPTNLPQGLNSTPWCVTLIPEDPKMVWMVTNLGQMYRSLDEGHFWEKMPHEFGEVRALHGRRTQYPTDRPAHSITVRQNPFAHTSLLSPLVT